MIGKLDRQDEDEDITPEMAIAGRKALAIVADRMEEAKLLATSSIDFWQRVGHEPANEIYRAMQKAAPSTRDATEDDLSLGAEHPINYRKAFARAAPTPAPDAMRDMLASPPVRLDREAIMALIEKHVSVTMDLTEGEGALIGVGQAADAIISFSIQSGVGEREPTPDMRIAGGIAWAEALKTAETYVDCADACWKAMWDAR